MSLYLRAYRSSAEHDKHVKIAEMCRANDVSLPRETAAYFGDDSEGVSANLSQDEVDELLQVGEVYVYDGDDVVRGNMPAALLDVEMQLGFEIDVASIPKGATRLRVFWSF